jgi:hypothetical protein
MARYLCKACGGESPTGIGYVQTMPAPLPEPDQDCPNPHAEPPLMCEYCGRDGCRWTNHAEARADVAAWTRQDAAERSPFGDHTHDAEEDWTR